MQQMLTIKIYFVIIYFTYFCPLSVYILIALTYVQYDVHDVVVQRDIVYLPFLLLCMCRLMQRVRT